MSHWPPSSAPHTLPDTPPVWLSTPARTSVVEHAQRQFPYEACGMLLGTEPGCITHVLPLPNAKQREGALAKECFAIAPADMARAFRWARDHGLQVMGFFHSHPLGDARPSAADVAGSPPWPGVAQLIVAVDERGRVQLQAYTPDAHEPRWNPRRLLTVLTRTAGTTPLV